MTNQQAKDIVLINRFITQYKAINKVIDKCSFIYDFIDDLESEQDIKTIVTFLFVYLERKSLSMSELVTVEIVSEPLKNDKDISSKRESFLFYLKARRAMILKNKR